MKKNLLVRFLKSILFAVIAIHGAAAAASEITFGTPGTFGSASADGILMNPGNGGYAVALGASSNIVTVGSLEGQNAGITFFAESNPFSGANPFVNISTSPGGLTNTTAAIFDSGSTFRTACVLNDDDVADSGFASVLNCAAYDGGTGISSGSTVTLGNLTTGRSYTVQLFFCDTRGNGRGFTVSNTDGTGTTAFQQFQYTSGPLAAYVTGSFVASGSTQSFIVNMYNSSGGSCVGFQLNAVVVAPNNEISFASPQTFTDDSVILYPGSGGYAVCFAPTPYTTTGSGAGPSTGVTFTDDYNANGGGFLSIANVSGATNSLGSGFETRTGGTGDTGFNNVLNYGVYDSTTSTGTVVTLNDLTPGQQYNVQLLFCDTTANGDGFSVSNTDGSGATTFQQYQYSPSGPIGAYVVGTFLANADTESLVVNRMSNSTTNIGFQLNAVVLQHALRYSQPQTFTSDSCILDPNTASGGYALAVGSSSSYTTASSADGSAVQFLACQFPFTTDTRLHITNPSGATSGTASGFSTRSTGDTSFDSALNTAAFDSLGSTINGSTIELQSLTPGMRYNVQLFFCDTRTGGNSRGFSAYDPYGNNNTPFQKYQYTSGPIGSYVIASFTATSSTQNLFLGMFPSSTQTAAADCGGFQLNAVVVQAVPVTFSKPEPIFDNSVILAPGSGGYAFAVGASSSYTTSGSANGSSTGVTFNALANPFSSSNTDVTITNPAGATGFEWNGFLPSGTTGDSGLNSVLANAAYDSTTSSPSTLTLKSLTAGTTYNVQLLFCDTRAASRCYSAADSINGAAIPIGTESSTPITQFAYAYTGQPVGSYVTGTFTATGSTQNILLSMYSDASAADAIGFQLNGVVVQPIPTTAVGIANNALKSDLLSPNNFWSGASPPAGHIINSNSNYQQPWERATLYHQMYNLWTKTNDSTLLSEMTNDWDFFGNPSTGFYTPSQLQSCGSGGLNFGTDDSGWACTMYIDAYYAETAAAGTADASAALTDAENLFANAVSRWYDTTYGGGLWYNDLYDPFWTGYHYGYAGDGDAYNAFYDPDKSLYEIGLIVSGLRIHNILGNTADPMTSSASYGYKAKALFDWLNSTSTNLRSDGLYWADYGDYDNSVSNPHAFGYFYPYTIAEGNSVVFMGGNIGMGVAAALLHNIIGGSDTTYSGYAQNTAIAIRAGLDPELDDNGVLLDDRDARADGMFMGDWATYVLPLVGTTDDYQLIKNSAIRIYTRDRTAFYNGTAYQYGLYGGDWDGPAGVDAQWTKLSTIFDPTTEEDISADAAGVIVANAIAN